MAKKPETDTAEIESVSVEMTTAQKDEFIAWKLAQEAKEKAAAEQKAKGTYRVKFQWEHIVNGKKYGPGEAEVPEALLGQMMKADQDRTFHELNLNTHNKRLVQLMGNGTKIVRNVEKM